MVGLLRGERNMSQDDANLFFYYCTSMCHRRDIIYYYEIHCLLVLVKSWLSIVKSIDEALQPVFFDRTLNHRRIAPTSW